MNIIRNHIIKIMIGTLISAILLFLIFQYIQFNHLILAFQQANPVYLIPLLISAFLFFWIKAVRWRLLLTPVQQVTTKQLIPSMMIGVSLNYILFGYLGELFRCYALRKHTGIRKSTSFATIALERIFDLLCVIILLGIGLRFSHSIPDEFIKLGTYIAGIGLISLAIAVICVLFPYSFIALADWTSHLIPESYRETFVKQVDSAILGLQSLQDSKLLLGVILTSIGQWLLMGLCNHFAMISVGINIPYTATFLTIALVVFGMTIPSSPGQFGVIEACYIIGLKAYGIETTAAFAAAIVYHFMLYVPVIIIGLYYLKHAGFTLKEANQEGS